MIVALFYKNSM